MTMKTWFVKKMHFTLEHTCYFLVKFFLAWFIYPNYAGDYKMANKNQKVSNGFPTSM